MRCQAGWLAALSLVVITALAAPAPDAAALPATAAPNEAWLAALLDNGSRLLDPAQADPDWHIPTVLADTPAASEKAAPLREMQRLETALSSHVAMARTGGWPMVPESADLQPGDRDPVVAQLRKRLRISGDYTAEMGADPWLFDSDMDAAVRRFQTRHGLAVTGVFDAAARAAANVSVEDRIGQLAVTLERWRWLPRELGERHVWINVGSSTLDVFAAGQSILGMRVIVGHPDRATPSLAGELRQVVFNPTWSVPRTIAVEDLLPRQVEDPTFLASRGFRIFRGNGAAERAVNPAAVDWARLGPDNFPYRLRQNAGPGNSLGRIKIAWDNPYDIYLHDTPSKGLFALGRRTLSSGCVRLEDAAALATLLLEQDRPWNAAETHARVNGAATQVINLRQRLPVYIVYLTAWVAQDGAVHFRRDIYGRDAKVLAALRGIGVSGRVSVPVFTY